MIRPFIYEHMELFLRSLRLAECLPIFLGLAPFSRSGPSSSSLFLRFEKHSRPPNGRGALCDATLRMPAFFPSQPTLLWRLCRTDGGHLIYPTRRNFLLALKRDAAKPFSPSVRESQPLLVQDALYPHSFTIVLFSSPPLDLHSCFPPFPPDPQQRFPKPLAESSNKGAPLTFRAFSCT